MKLKIFAALLVALSSIASARDYSTADGQFTVCKFRLFAACAVLTQAELESNRFSPKERDTVERLKSFVTSEHFDGADLI